MAALDKQGIEAELVRYANELSTAVVKAKQSVCEVTGRVVKTEMYRFAMRDWLKGRKEEWATDLYTIFKEQKIFVRNLEQRGCSMNYQAYR